MKKKDVGDTKFDFETGAELHRGVQKLKLCYKGKEKIIDMPGWYSADGSIAEYSKQDMKVSDRALNFLKAESEGLPTPSEIRSIRKRFKLSQVQAGSIIGGGTRAFQKYEAGDVLPSRTLANLLRVLDRNPGAMDILKEN